MKPTQRRLAIGGAFTAAALLFLLAWRASLVPATHPDHDHGILNLDAGGRLMVEGRDDKLYLQIEECAPDLETVLDRILGGTPPALDSFGAIDLEGIRSGRILEGMSRQGVFRAVGYPPFYYRFHDVRNPDLEAEELDTWWREHRPKARGRSSA